MLENIKSHDGIFVGCEYVVRKIVPENWDSGWVDNMDKLVGKKVKISYIRPTKGKEKGTYTWNAHIVSNNLKFTIFDWPLEAFWKFAVGETVLVKDVPELSKSLFEDKTPMHSEFIAEIIAEIMVNEKVEIIDTFLAENNEPYYQIKIKEGDLFWLHEKALCSLKKGGKQSIHE
jgi:hypothetical protein